MAIFKELLGYECRSMALSEVEERTRELLAKYAAFAQKHT
jgi:predicted ATPase